MLIFNCDFSIKVTEWTNFDDVFYINNQKKVLTEPLWIGPFDSISLFIKCWGLFTAENFNWVVSNYKFKWRYMEKDQLGLNNFLTFIVCDFLHTAIVQCAQTNRHTFFRDTLLLEYLFILKNKILKFLIFNECVWDTF